MDNFWSILYDKIISGTDLIMTTITAAKGSVPRGAGARMLISDEGRIAGTVGGGAVEYECIKTAQDMLREGRTSTGTACRHFILDKNDVADIGMVCGGDVDILFQYISADDESLRETFKTIDECTKKHKRCEITYKFTGDEIAEMNVSITTPETVYIFGGGHVAQQLVPILDRCDFNCVVIEDRPEFADPGLFENKCDIILVEEGTLSDNLPEITENDFVCIMTRGHKDDYLLQAAILKKKTAYIGVIGSRRKVAAVNEKLRADGYSQEDIDRITSPIGLDIMSETPAEIAVSIAAQLIMVRAKQRENKFSQGGEG